MFVFFYKGLDNIESGSDIIRRIDTIVNLLYRYKFTPPPPRQRPMSKWLSDLQHTGLIVGASKLAKIRNFKDAPSNKWFWIR